MPGWARPSVPVSAPPAASPGTATSRATSGPSTRASRQGATRRAEDAPMPGRKPVRRGRVAALLAHVVTLVLLLGAPAAFAQSAGNEAATIAELRRQLDAMQRRLEQLEARTAKRPPVAA